MPGLRLNIRDKINQNYYEMKDLIKEQKVHSICEEAECPNKFECYSSKTATFLINSEPNNIDTQEPYRVAEAINKLGLEYAVISSVNRDDLVDGGASFFSETTKWIRRLSPNCLIEVLVPDFNSSEVALKCLFRTQPDVFNHNIETVQSLHSQIRPQADYDRSLEILHKAKQNGLITKSGLMVGLGETQQEIIDAMQDIRATGCDILTIGQYLRPSAIANHPETKRYYRVQEYNFLNKLGMTMNFKVVISLPLAKSCYKVIRPTTHIWR